MASEKLHQAVNDNYEGTIDMSPMIDMVFLLLMFFLLASSPKFVTIDGAVNIPVAANAEIAKIKHGRIVVNIRSDGEYRDESANVSLDTDQDLRDYIKENADKVTSQGFTPRLHLRGDTDAVFRYCRRVIRAGAEVGVNEVIFATYTN